MTRPSALNHQPYLEAVAEERLSRDAAMLGVRESISGFEVVPLTLWHLLILRIMRHPILANENPSPEQLAQFLWLLSPEFSPHNLKGRRKLIRTCRKRFYPPRYLALFNTRAARERHENKRQDRLAEAAKIIKAAQTYLAEALQDRPASAASRFEPDYYSDGIAFCAKFAREYGGGIVESEKILHLPLKRVFQYLNECKLANGSKVPLCNPSDSVKAQFYRELNQSLSEGRRERNARIRGLTVELKAKESERKANKKRKR